MPSFNTNVNKGMTYKVSFKKFSSVGKSRNKQDMQWGRNGPKTSKGFGLEKRQKVKYM